MPTQRDEDARPDPEWEDAWLREIAARRQRGGEVVPWEEARARVTERLSRPANEQSGPEPEHGRAKPR